MTTLGDGVREPEPDYDLNGDPMTLLEATNRLTRSVDTLTERVEVPVRMARQNRWLSMAIALIVLAGGLISAVQWERATTAIEGTAANAVQGCENANETRAANLQLWTYILNLSSQDATEEDKQRIDAFTEWVRILYQPHDCTHLEKEYQIPPPPPLGSPSTAANP